MQDALTHVVNAAEWLVGPVTRLAADVDHQVLDGVTVEDTAHVLTRHGRVMGCFSLNQHQAPNEVDDHGRLHPRHRPVRVPRVPAGGGRPSRAGRGPTSRPRPLERDTLFVRQADAFLDAVEGKAAPLCTLADARQTLAVNLAILRSAERGELGNDHRHTP